MTTNQKYLTARGTLNRLFPDDKWPRRDYLGRVGKMDDDEGMMVWLFHNCEDKCRMFASKDNHKIFELSRPEAKYTPNLFNTVKDGLITPLHNGSTIPDNCWTMLDLRRADLQEANLRGAHLQEANLRGAYLQGADLRRADLQEANLQGADLRGADLQEANLRGAHLQEAYLQGAYLRGANLRGAHLREANLSHRNKEYAKERGAIVI